MTAAQLHARAEAAQLPRECRTCPGWKQGLCGSLPPNELRQLAASATRKRNPAGTELISPWSSSDGCGMLLTGVAKASKMLADGRQQIVALKTGPDFLGRPFAVEPKVSVRAVTDVEFCSFQRPTFEAIVARNQGFEHRLHLHALRELDDAQDLLLALGRKTAREKVASFLVLVLSFNKEEAVETTGRSEERALLIDLPFTRAEVADFLGLTFETVSRQFASFKRDGIIGFTGARRVTIHDLKRLDAATGS